MCIVCAWIVRHPMFSFPMFTKESFQWPNSYLEGRTRWGWRLNRPKGHQYALLMTAKWKRTCSTAQTRPQIQSLEERSARCAKKEGKILTWRKDRITPTTPPKRRLFSCGCAGVATALFGPSLHFLCLKWRQVFTGIVACYSRAVLQPLCAQTGSWMRVRSGMGICKSLQVSLPLIRHKGPIWVISCRQLRHIYFNFFYLRSILYPHRCAFKWLDVHTSRQ